MFWAQSRQACGGYRSRTLRLHVVIPGNPRLKDLLLRPWSQSRDASPNSLAQPLFLRRFPMFVIYYGRCGKTVWYGLVRSIALVATDHLITQSLVFLVYLQVARSIV